jgi:uncharacterized protein
VIVDARVLVAAANDSDPDAIPCRQLLQTANGPLIVSAPALAEASYLIQKRLGPTAEIRLIESLLVPPWRVEGPTLEDLQRTARLMLQYVDLPLGFSDACSVAIAERTGTITIASLDNHFRIVKPRHGTAFEVRP